MSSIRGNRGDDSSFCGQNTLRGRRTVSDKLSLDIETNPNLASWRQSDPDVGHGSLSDHYVTGGEVDAVEGVYFLDGWMDSMVIDEDKQEEHGGVEQIDMDVLKQQGDISDVQHGQERDVIRTQPRVRTNKNQASIKNQPSPYSSNNYNKSIGNSSTIHVQLHKKTIPNNSNNLNPNIKRVSTKQLPKRITTSIITNNNSIPSAVNPYNELLPVNILNSAEQARVNREQYYQRQENTTLKQKYSALTDESSNKLKQITVELTQTSKKQESCELRQHTLDVEFEQRSMAMMHEAQLTHEGQLSQLRKQLQNSEQAYHNRSMQQQQEVIKGQNYALRQVEMEDRQEELRFNNGELVEKQSIANDKEQRLQVQQNSKDVQQHDMVRKCEELVMVEQQKIGELLDGYRQLEEHIHRQEQVLFDTQKEAGKVNADHKETTRILQQQISGQQERLELRNSRSINEVEQAVAKSISKSTMEQIHMQQQVKSAEERVIAQIAECDRIVAEKHADCEKIVKETVQQVEKQSRSDKASLALERARLATIIKKTQQGSVLQEEMIVDTTDKEDLEGYILDYLYTEEEESTEPEPTLDQVLHKHTRDITLSKRETRVQLKSRNQQLLVFDQFTASRAYDLSRIVKQAYATAQDIVGEQYNENSSLTSLLGASAHGSSTRLSTASSTTSLGSSMINPEKRKIGSKMKPVVCSQCCHTQTPDALHHVQSLQENAFPKKTSTNNSALSSPSNNNSGNSSTKHSNTSTNNTQWSLICETMSQNGGSVSTSVLPYVAAPSLATVNIPCPLSNTPICVSDAASLVANPWTKHKHGHTTRLILGPQPTMDTVATLFQEPATTHTEVYTSIHMNNGPANLMRQSLQSTTTMPTLVTSIRDSSTSQGVQSIPAWLAEWSFGKELVLLTPTKEKEPLLLFETEDAETNENMHVSNWWYSCLKVFYESVKCSLDDGRLPQKQTPWLQWIVDSCVRKNQNIFQKGMITLDTTSPNSTTNNANNNNNNNNNSNNSNNIHDTSVLHSILRTRMGFGTPTLLATTPDTPIYNTKQTSNKGSFSSKHPVIHKTLLTDQQALSTSTIQHQVYNNASIDEPDVISTITPVSIPVPFVLQQLTGLFLMLQIQSVEAALCKQWYTKSRAILEATLTMADKLKQDAATTRDKDLTSYNERLQTYLEENKEQKEEIARLQLALVENNSDISPPVVVTTTTPMSPISQLPGGHVMKRASISTQHSPTFTPLRPSFTSVSPLLTNAASSNPLSRHNSISIKQSLPQSSSHTSVESPAHQKNMRKQKPSLSIPQDMDDE